MVFYRRAKSPSLHLSLLFLDFHAYFFAMFPHSQRCLITSCMINFCRIEFDGFGVYRKPKLCLEVMSDFLCINTFEEFTSFCCLFFEHKSSMFGNCFDCFFEFFLFLRLMSFLCFFVRFFVIEHRFVCRFCESLFVEDVGSITRSYLVDFT